MFIFDIETLSKQSTAVILSFACVHIDPDKDYTYDELVENSFFVKLNAKDQVKNHHRTMQKSTLDWWNKQCDIVKKRSFIPSEQDVDFETGYNQFKKWVNKINEKNALVFARGNLDQLVLDDYQEQLQLEPIFPHYQWRDVRTAVDMLTDSTTGYCRVKNFDPQARVFKHDPVHDVAYDALMLLYGVTEQ